MMKTRNEMSQMTPSLAQRLMQTVIHVPIAGLILLAPFGPVERTIDSTGSVRTSCAELAYASHITWCDQTQLDALRQYRSELEYEKWRLETRLQQITPEITAAITAAKPFLDAMCLELQQALDLINQGIAVCPNGGNPVAIPAFCVL